MRDLLTISPRSLMFRATGDILLKLRLLLFVATCKNFVKKQGTEFFNIEPTA
jgi:hypothetical protein